VAATVALGLPALASAVPASSAPAPSWPSQLVRPAAVRCPRGAALVAPTAGSTDALGVAHIGFRAEPGLVAKIPPRGLTAAHVTQALLADLGLRIRQPLSSPAGRHLVQDVIRLAADRTAPEFCRSKPRPKRPGAELSGPQVPNRHVYSPNWAGYAVTDAEHGGPINAAEGTWTVPRGMTRKTPSIEGTWVGVGGGLAETSSAEGLIQTGTSMQNNGDYQSWWEYIGTSGCVNQFCGQYSEVGAIAPGDSVGGVVDWESRSSACFLFVDFSRSSGELSVCKTLNIPYDPTSGEWVNEYPFCACLYDNPGTVHWRYQYLNSGFGADGTWTSSFARSFESVILFIGISSGTGCNEKPYNSILSYPVHAANYGPYGGQSDIVTCVLPKIDPH
jgi:hypothetical protein